MKGGGGGMDARRLTRLALLTAVALSLFVVELQLPDLFPIPGAKLGLANIVTVYALYRCRAGEAAIVLAARILLGGLLEMCIRDRHNATRRSVLQKVQSRALLALPLLVNTGFQVLFHSPPGVLFTFPSRYYALSVTDRL